MQTEDWNQVGPFTLYRALSRPTALCTFIYAIAIYYVGEFSSVPFGAAIDIALLFIATFLLGYLGRSLGILTREDTVWVFWRFGELVLSLPAFWVSLAYVLTIYKGQLTFDDMTLPYLDKPLWPWFFLIFFSSYFTGRLFEPKLEALMTNLRKRIQGKNRT